MTERLNTAAERAKLAALEGHTPGPWYAGQPENANGWWVVATDVECHDCVDSSGDGGFDESDARLIAAAPDLKTTLAAALDELDRLQLCVSHANLHADAAISEMDDLKAENERLRKAVGMAPHE